jgi:secondary thiamine-phosphate synthase enzyme
MEKKVIQTTKRSEMVDITNLVQKYVLDNNVDKGIILVYVPHTTAGITVNEGADPSVQQDILSFLNKLIPKDNDFHHSEGNSDAHIKASMIGSSVSLIVSNGELVLGTWQHIFFFEGDGPRKRHVLIYHISH